MYSTPWIAPPIVRKKPHIVIFHVMRGGRFHVKLVPIWNSGCRLPSNVRVVIGNSAKAWFRIPYSVPVINPTLHMRKNSYQLTGSVRRRWMHGYSASRMNQDIMLVSPVSTNAWLNV